MNDRNGVRRHLSFANVASALALFLAIGGGTTAIALKGKNRVDSGDIRNGAVRTGDIRNGGVKTRDLGKNAATGAKVNESTLSIVPNANELDGISSEDFQFGNGITAAVAGAVDDGPTFGRVDLGSATLEIDCEDPVVNLNVQDDAGGAVPNGGAPTDVWINGVHESIVVDAGSTTPVAVDTSTDPTTVPVQIWTTDNVVTNAQLSVAFDVPNDVCVVTLPLQQNLVVGAPLNSASAAGERLSPPTVSGFLPR